MPYDFTQDGFRSFSDDLLKTEGDQAGMTTVLADMQDTYTKSIASLETANHDLEEIKKENERLKNANMELFLRIGSFQKEKPSESLKDPEPVGTKEYMQKFFESQK